MGNLGLEVYSRQIPATQFVVSKNTQCTELHQSSLHCVYFRELEDLMLLKDQRKSYLLMLNFHQFVNHHFYLLVWRVQEHDDV